MQEVYSCPTELPRLFADFAALEELQKDLTYPHSFYAPAFSFDFLGSKVEMGNAILSRLPLEEQRIVFTSEAYHHRRIPEDVTGNTRNVQICKLTPKPGHHFWLANHHGYHDLNPLGGNKTVEKTKELIRNLQPLDGQLILSSDLNIIAASPAMRLFDNWLRDLTAEYKISTTLNQFGKVDDVACDHILVSAGVEVKNFQVSHALVSDHKALVLEFEI